MGGVLQSLNPRVPGGGPTWGSQPPSRPNCSHMGTPRAPFCPPVVLMRAAAVSECPCPHSVRRMGSPWFLSTPQPQTCPCMAVLVVPQPPVSPGASLYGGPSCSMSSPVSPGVSPYGGPSCSMSPPVSPAVSPYGGPSCSMSPPSVPRGVLTGRSPQSLCPSPSLLPKGGVPTLCPPPPRRVLGWRGCGAALRAARGIPCATPPARRSCSCGATRWQPWARAPARCCRSCPRSRASPSVTSTSVSPPRPSRVPAPG